MKECTLIREHTHDPVPAQKDVDDVKGSLKKNAKENPFVSTGEVIANTLEGVLLTPEMSSLQ